MITQTLIYNVTGTAPFNYSIVDANQLNCMVITPANGTSANGQITFTISANTSECFTEVDLILTVTDSEGCIGITNIALTDPCENFNASPIYIQNLYTFAVGIFNGTPPYSYEWTWDLMVFKLDNPSSSTSFNYIDLELNTNNPPPTTTVSVLLTDGNNCTLLKTYSYVFCFPTAQDTAVTLVCNKKNGVSYNDNVFLSVLPCPNINDVEIDWTTLTFATPSNIYVEHMYQTQPSSPPNQIKIYTSAAYPPGVKQITYSVSDTNGVISNTGVIHVTIPACTIPFNIFIPSTVIQIPCDLNIGDEYEIDICALVSPFMNFIDWSTFQFLLSGTNIATSPLGVIENYPDNLSFSAKGCTLTYTVPANTGTDSFQWQVSDINGNVSNATITAIYLDCATVPVAVNDTACSTCGLPVVINALSNDTIAGGASIFPQSIQITEQPTNGTAFIDSNWNIVYTPNFNFEGEDTIKYKVGNNVVPVEYSSEGTITIQVLCAGENVFVTVC